MIIVYAVVNTEGKVGQAEVKQTPDAAFDQMVLDTLGQWTFRPGLFDGLPVRMKLLIGIPVSSLLVEPTARASAAVGEDAEQWRGPRASATQQTSLYPPPQQKSCENSGLKHPRISPVRDPRTNLLLKPY